jgi:hypothetical protein
VKYIPPKGERRIVRRYYILSQEASEGALRGWRNGFEGGLYRFERVILPELIEAGVASWTNLKCSLEHTPFHLLDWVSEDTWREVNRQIGLQKAERKAAERRLRYIEKISCETAERLIENLPPEDNYRWYSDEFARAEYRAIVKSIVRNHLASGCAHWTLRLVIPLQFL